MNDDEPRPWACGRCGARLLWRRTEVVCPTHGHIAALYPNMPTDSHDPEFLRL